MKIDKYEVNSLIAGEFALDGGAMFGVIPKVMWEKKIPADERNRIPMMTRLLLIRGDGKIILTDTGCGNKFSAKLSDIYKVDTSNALFEKRLKKFSFTPEDVTDVVLTHLHFDHVGGATKISADGKITSTFPNAKYYIQKLQLEWAKNPSERDKASFFEENFQPLIDAKQLEILDGPKELYPGINLYVTMGHTNSQQHVIVKDEKTTLFYCADLFPTSAHIKLPWVMGYDLRPLVTVEEKKYILEKASAENWILFFEHCPLIAACRVRKVEKGYEMYDEMRDRGAGSGERGAGSENRRMITNNGGGEKVRKSVA